MEELLGLVEVLAMGVVEVAARGVVEEVADKRGVIPVISIQVFLKLMLINQYLITLL